MKKKFFALAAILITSPLLSNDIYESVDLVPFDPAGHFAAAESLDRIFRKNEIKTVIEIGSWAGRSTRFFANWVGEGGTVYAIDHWEGTPNHRGEMTDPRLPHIYHLFLSNTAQMGMQDVVVPIRMNSDEAFEATSFTADLVYIDAGRDEERVCRDILNWSQRVNSGGFLCGAEIREPEVRNGVFRAARKLGCEVEGDKKGHFWRIKL